MSFGCYANSIYYNNIKIQNKKMTEFFAVSSSSKYDRNYSNNIYTIPNKSKKITDYFNKK